MNYKKNLLINEDFSAMMFGVVKGLISKELNQ